MTHRSRPRVAIIGMGLMGGSLGLALARKGWRVVGVGRRPARLRRAKSRGCAHEVTTDWRKGAAGCSVVVLAVPVDRIVPWARALRPFLDRDCLMMDVGSVKAPIVRTLDRLFGGRRGARFVGVHPMAGSEKSGVEHAQPDLYKGAACVVTPGPRTPPQAVRRAETFWRAVGGRPVRLSPGTHDRWIALVSHLPHLVADSMMLALARERGADRFARRLAAGSFRDMTRVAGADPRQWSAIFRMNAGPVRRAAGLLQGSLRRLLRNDFSRSDLERAKTWRNTYLDER